MYDSAFYNLSEQILVQFLAFNTQYAAFSTFDIYSTPNKSLFSNDLKFQTNSPTIQKFPDSCSLTNDDRKCAVYNTTLVEWLNKFLPSVPICTSICTMVHFQTCIFKAHRCFCTVLRFQIFNTVTRAHSICIILHIVHLKSNIQSFLSTFGAQI